MINTSLKNRILVPLTFVLFSLLIVFLTGLFWSERNNIKERVERQFKSTEHFFYSQLENDARLFSGMLETIMNDRVIQAALKAGDRKALLSHTASLFKRMSFYHPVTHFYFSDALRINLLRVHQPDRYGDRIDRFTTLEAEKTGKIAYGLELGPLGTLTLRVVAPMSVDGKRIGFVELGEEIDHITDKLKKTIGVEFIVHIHKKFLNRSGWEAGMKMLGRTYDWDQFPDVVLVQQTLPVKPEALTKFFSEGSHTLGAIDEEIFSQKHRYRCRSLAIKDVKGVEVGDMVIMIDVTGQVTNLYYTMGMIAIFSVFLGGVLFFLFRFFLGRVENQLITDQQKIIDLEKDRTRMESEAKFYTVAQSVNDAMISGDESGKINFWNPAAAIMFGYQEEEVLEQPLTMIVPERYREAHQKGMERLQTGGDGRIIGKTTELFGLKKDGTEFPLELSLARWTAGNETFYTGLIRDITKRKRAEEMLRAGQLQLRAILDNIPDIAWLKDKESRLIAVNEPFGKACGFEPEDLVGKTDLDIWPRDLAERYRADDKEVMESGKRRQVEEPLKDAEGRILWIETIKTPIYDEHGDISGTAGIARDITERKRAEEKLQKTLKSLRKAFGTTIQVMVSAVETRDPYTSGHQIRTANLARAIATEMGLSEDRIEAIRMAGPIHDIGKLSVPAEILSKPGKLSQLEFSLIKEHSRKGYEMLKDVESPWPLAEIVYQHHERINGSGYPRNLKGKEIIMEARIMAVADVVESMASYRPYRPAIGINHALEEIEKNKETLYDADVVDACLRLFREKGFQITEA